MTVTPSRSQKLFRGRRALGALLTGILLGFPVPQAAIGAAPATLSITDAYAQPGGDFYTMVAELDPALPMAEVRFTLYGKRSGKWAKVDSRTLSPAFETEGSSVFYSETDFLLVKRATACKVVAHVAGDADDGATTDARRIPCKFRIDPSRPVSVSSGEVPLCVALTESTGLRCVQAAELFGLGLRSTNNSARVPTDPIDLGTLIPGLPQIDSPVSDALISVSSVLVPSAMTHITDPLNDELGSDRLIGVGGVLGAGGGGTGASRTNAKYVGDSACGVESTGGRLSGVSVLLKPSSPVSPDYGFRIIERQTEATPKSGWYAIVVSHRLVDLSDPPPGRIVRWDPSGFQDYSSGNTVSLSVGWGGFSSSMSWSHGRGRAGGARPDPQEHVAGYRHASGSDLTIATKSETLFRYIKPHGRKSWYLPCSALYAKP